MKDTYDFTYAQDLRHFIGLLLDDYCPTQLKIFDSDIVYDVIKDLKQFKMELTGNRIFGDCCLECNALLNKDLEQLKEDLSYTDMDELSEEEKEIVKEFLDSYKGNYNLIEFDCNGQCSTIWIRDNLTDSELEACQIIDKHFDVFKNLEDRVDIELFGIRKEEISTEMNEIEEDLDEIEMWDDWKEADEHGEPVATFHGAFLDLFAKEKSQSIDKNLISFNSCTFEINLDSKDNGEGCLKWHNYFLTDIHNKDHFYIIQIVQETGKEEPRFSLEKFEKEEGSKLYLGEWVELEDVIKNSSEIEMVQNKLIELSDKEIGIQNEEIKNIEDDFEELDEVEK